MKRITVDLTKASTESLDLTDKLNPRVGDGQLSVPLHIIYGTDDSGNDDPVDMRDKDIEFLSQDTNKNDIYVSGAVTTNSKGDDPYNGNVTFVFPEGTFKVAGTYDVDKTMFRIINKADKIVLSTVNVKLNVLEGGNSDYNFDPNKTSYNSRLEDMLKLAQSQMKDKIANADKEAQAILTDAKQKSADIVKNASDQAQSLLDDIKQTNDEAKSNVAGDTAATAKYAKQQANDNAGKVHDLQGEVGDARGRFMTLSDRENKQDFNIDRKEDKVNANANYAAINLRDDQQDKAIAEKASQGFITDYLSKMYLQPEGFENEAALKAKYPTGKEGIFVTVDTGHKWLWINGAWKDCGIYQSAGLDSELQHQLTSLDVSEEKVINLLQPLTNNLINLRWSVGYIDDNGMLNYENEYRSAFSSKINTADVKRLYIKNSGDISSTTVFSFDASNKMIDKTICNANSSIVYQAPANASYFYLQVGHGYYNVSLDELSSLINQLTLINIDSDSIVDKLKYKSTSEKLTLIYPTASKCTINDNVNHYEKVEESYTIAAGWNTYVIDCKPGDLFKLNGIIGGSDARAYAFLNSDNKLIYKSGASVKIDQGVLYTPSGANKLIINHNYGQGYGSVYKYEPNKNRYKYINLAKCLDTGVNIALAFDLGQEVSLTPEEVPTYSCCVIDCLANDEFHIKGTGGNNPRLWGFLNDKNELLQVAQANPNGITEEFYLKAPTKARKLVLNFNNPAFSFVELYKLPHGTIRNPDNVWQHDKKDNGLKLASMPVDVEMSSYLNGIKLAQDLNNHLADFAKPGDKMVHVSTFCKAEDNLYVSYYANTRTSVEDPSKQTARLVYAPFSDLTHQTYIDVADVGQDYNGKSIDAIYDSVILKTSDDSYFIYAFTAKIGENYTMLYRRFDTKEKSLSKIFEMSFSTKNSKLPFTTSNIHDALADIGIDYPYRNNDISFMQNISTHIEDGTIYYYTGIGIFDFCMIIKSSDLIHWQFVTTPSFTYEPVWEGSAYIVEDSLYYFCRQETSSYAILAKYDLNLGTWTQPISVPDAQSRYCFFLWEDNLYLVHSPYDRNHLSLMMIDKNKLDQSHEVATAIVNDCFYPFVQNINGQMYMSFTQSRQHIWLSRFTPVYLSGNDVLEKFTKLLPN